MLTLIFLLLSFAPFSWLNQNILVRDAECMQSLLGFVYWQGERMLIQIRGISGISKESDVAFFWVLYSALTLFRWCPYARNLRLTFFC